MKFGTYQLGHKTSACAVMGQFVYDLAQAFFKHYKRPYKFPDLLPFLEMDGYEKLKEFDLGKMKDEKTVCVPLREVRMCAPLLRPPKIVCVGLNYKDHALEQKKDPPTAPLLFSKASNVVIGDGDAIKLPVGISDKVDYEVELGVVIGKEAFKVRKSDALSHVFGYTVVNDVTARDLQQNDKQWFRAKSLATFCPMGPVIVSADEIPNPQNLALELTVNNKPRQKSSTQEMIFDVASLIEYISAAFPLEVGDVIATGTPAGVGVFRSPPVFLHSGDEVMAKIENVGTLRNTVE